ncbi:hypothetical protein GCM10020331_030600 [Ectobacillus funiculus]
MCKKQIDIYRIYRTQKFHRLISKGLLGIYLSDQKGVGAKKEMQQMARRIVKYGGAASYFFLCECEAVPYAGLGERSTLATNVIDNLKQIVERSSLISEPLGEARGVAALTLYS